VNTVKYSPHLQSPSKRTEFYVMTLCTICYFWEN